MKRRFDIPLLEQHQQAVAVEKEQLLLEAAADKGDLMSTDKFKQLLVDRGVEIEYKPSPSDPARLNPCFAKSDQFMTDLLENDDPAVQALAAARLGVRSTIEESRCRRLHGELANDGETAALHGGPGFIP